MPLKLVYNTKNYLKILLIIISVDFPESKKNVGSVIFKTNYLAVSPICFRKYQDLLFS